MKNKKPTAKRNRSALLGFAYRMRKPDGKWTLRLRWGRIAAALSTLAVLTYITLASAVFLFLKYRQNYEEASYWRTYLLPFRRDAHRQEMGDYQIRRAKELLEAGDIRSALAYVRGGVARSPRNLEGRILLSEFFLALLRRPDMALQILRDGREAGQHDIDYMRRYIQVLLSEQQDAEILEVTEELLQSPSLNPEMQRLLALAAATANRFRGYYDAAEDVVDRYNLEKDMEGVLLSAQISWDRGQQSVAIGKLESALGRFRSNEPIYALLVRYHREQKNYSKARQYAVLRNISSPTAIAPRIDFLMILHETGETEREHAEAAAMFEQYKDDERGLAHLGRYAAEAGRVELSRQIYNSALENNFDPAPYTLSLIETQLVAGDYLGAIEFTEQLDEEQPEWLERHKALFNSLRSVAYFGNGNEERSRLYLDQFLQEKNLRVDVLLSVSKRFRDMGGYRQAREILIAADRDNQANQPVLTALVDLEMYLGNSAKLTDYLQRLLRMRRPSQSILKEAYRQLGSDRFIFARNRDNVLLELHSMIQ